LGEEVIEQKQIKLNNNPVQGLNRNNYNPLLLASPVKMKKLLIKYFVLILFGGTA